MIVFQYELFGVALLSFFWKMLNVFHRAELSVMWTYKSYQVANMRLCRR